MNIVQNKKEWNNVIISTFFAESISTSLEPLMKEGREDKRLQNMINNSCTTMREDGIIIITLDYILLDASVPYVSDIGHWGLVQLRTRRSLYDHQCK